MSNSKMITGSLIALQLITNIVGVASARADAPSPEENFLAQVMTLQGANLSQTDFQKQVMADMKDYESAAPSENRDQRTQQALVDLGLYSPAQAKQLSNSLAQANTQDVSSLIQVIQSQPAGAQFSGCKTTTDLAIYFGGGAVAVGAIVAIIGSSNNPELSVEAGQARRHSFETTAGITAGAGAVLLTIGLIVNANSQGC